MLYIFSLVPALHRKCVELGAGSGVECNTANLILNHGWWGWLFDGDERNVRDGQAFFAEHKDSFLCPPRFVASWLTAERVDDVLVEAEVSGPVDLLSIDIDGMDYWVWKAIRAIEPQVVVCEVNNVIPPELSLTVPYAADFSAREGDDFRGASLLAMTRLANEKGYRLVGTHRFGFNAFFIARGIGEEWFPEVTVSSCLTDPFSEAARRCRWPAVAARPWDTV